MKRSFKFIVLTVGLAAASADVGTAAPGEAHRQGLLKNAYQDPSATSPKAARLRLIPANTPAFREYALSLMLTQANHINDALHLGLRSPVTADDVTGLAATATIPGIAGGITISNRFHIRFGEGAFTGYQDWSNSWQSVERDLPRLGQLAKQPSLITAEEAARIASEALRSLGVVPRRFDLMDEPVTEQHHTYSRDDHRLPLPLFLVRWKPTPEAQFDNIRIEVSGLTSKIVAYENYRTPPLPLPTNYFQMLGISPDRKDWGRQYGYDPMHSAAFEQFARGYAAEHLNRALRLWQLDAPLSLGTNDITWFHVKPHTNAPAIAASFTNRFYLQIGEGHLGLFEDKAHSASAFSADASKLANPALMTNTLDDRAAIELARQALRRLGLDEKQLRLVEPPTVSQAEISSGEPDRTLKLPLYDVIWPLPPTERARLGDGAAVAFQISAVTRRVAMFANNCPWTPALNLPTNYARLLGLDAPAPRLRPVLPQRK